MIKKVALFTILVLFTGLLTVQAQASLNTAGGEGSGSGGSTSYTIGQMFYSVQSSSSGFVAMGVQVPYSISVIRSIKQAEFINLSCLAFPNPVGDWLYLKVDNTELNDLSFKLIDMGGRILINKDISDVSTGISMQSFSTGPYILKVYQDRLEIKSFKIIKN